MKSDSANDTSESLNEFHMWSVKKEMKREVGERWLKSWGQTIGQREIPIRPDSCEQGVWETGRKRNREKALSHKVWVYKVWVQLPVSCGRNEVYAAVNPWVRDSPLPVDVDFLLQVHLILVVDEFHDGLPAGEGNRGEAKLCYADLASFQNNNSFGVPHKHVKGQGVPRTESFHQI